MSETTLEPLTAMDVKEMLRSMYGGENKRITGEGYDKSLAVKCVNGTFVGKKTENIIMYRGIQYVGKQPVGELRWKAPVDVVPDDGSTAENFAKIGLSADSEKEIYHLMDAVQKTLVVLDDKGNNLIKQNVPAELLEE